MEKRFEIADVGGVLHNMGIRVQQEWNNRGTRLRTVELMEVSGDDFEGPGFDGFELVFMDPHDDLFYRARVPYDDIRAYVDDWPDLVDSEGIHVGQFETVIDDFGSPDTRGILPGDMLSCPRVEKRDVTVKRWVTV